MTCPVDFLELCADKKGTYIINVALNGIVNDFAWKVSDEYGAEISTGTETPALSINVLLSNAVLGVPAGYRGDIRRVFTVSGTYNSVLYSFNNEPYTAETNFFIKNYIGVPST